MKKSFYGFAVVIGLLIMTGCETGKYAVDQTFSGEREFGPNSRETHPVPDNGLAAADDWVRKNIW